METLLIQYCKRLHFGSNIVSNAKSISAESNIDFLTELFKMELDNREIKRKNTYIKQANFDIKKTFENYSFEGIQIPSTITAEDIMRAAFINKKENLILYGPVGTGKTHMAIAVGICACNKSIKVKFFRAAALVNELVDAKKNGTLRRFMKSLEKCDLLICDEWGYVPVDSEGAKLLFQVIADCYERKSLIITTNLEFGKWNGIFYDEKITAAIIDRVVHHSHLIVFDRPSYRVEYSTIRAGERRRETAINRQACDPGGDAK
jgi:DNA replication protein DnaC